jgi:hypothetical protein
MPAPQTHVTVDSPLPLPVEVRNFPGPVAGVNLFTVSLFSDTGAILNANGRPITFTMSTLPRVGDLIAMDDANNVRRIRAVQYRNISVGDIRVLVTDIKPWSQFG